MPSLAPPPRPGAAPALTARRLLVRLPGPVLLASLLLAGAAGCGTLGPVVLPGERFDYNQALQRSNDEQLLLNVTRLQYRDTPSFLEVNNITAQAAAELTLRGDVTAPEYQNRVFGFGGTGFFASRPTVQYAPLRGEEFVQRLLAPISLEKVILLYRSGWSLGRVFNLTVQRLNGVRNVFRAGGLMPEEPEKYREFLRVLSLLRALEDREQIDFVYEKLSPEDVGRVALRVEPAAWNDPLARELAARLGLRPGLPRYPLISPTTQDRPEQGLESIMVETRSLYSAMFLLSHGVEVAEEDLTAGRAAMASYASEGFLAWRKLLQSIFTVRATPHKPTGAAVAVRYRDRWYSIDDADLESKATFSFLYQLFAMQAGRPESAAPLLTIPAR